ILHSQLKYHNYHFVVNKMEIVLNHSNLQEIKRVPINIDEKNAYAPKLFKIGNSLVIFYVFYDDSQKLNTLVSLKINENDFAIEEKKIFGIAKRNKADFNFLAVNNIPQILPEYRYTPNKKQLVVYFQVKE